MLVGRSSLLTCLALVGALATSAWTSPAPASALDLERRLLASTPPPPLAGRGPSPGEASVAATAQLCQDLARQLGGSKVVQRGLNLDMLRYADSNSHYYSAVNQDENPVCVVYPSEPVDVQKAFKGIRQTKAAFAVVAGGHNTNWGWNSTPGVLLDLRNMRKLVYDAASSTVDMGPGLRWGEVYERLEKRGVTVMGGRLSNVGFGALLTGGLSHLANQHGLGSDAIVSALVVLPSGDLVEATRTNRYKDLLWGLGAAGNQLGIVAQVRLKAFPLGKWWGGMITYVGRQAVDAAHDAVMNYTSRFETLGKAASKTTLIPTFTWLATPVSCIAQILLVNNDAGPPAAGIFDEFFRIPHLKDETRRRSFAQPGDGLTTLFDFGATFGLSAYTYDTTFTTFSFRPSRASGFKSIGAIHDLAAEQLTRYTTISYSPEQLSRSTVRNGRSTSGGAGNPYGLQESDGDLLFSTLAVNNLPLLPTGEKQALAQGIRDMIRGGKVPDEKDLPLFLSYSSAWQSAALRLRGFERLKAVKQKYDAEELLVRLTNGPAFRDVSEEVARPREKLLKLGLPGAILGDGI